MDYEIMWMMACDQTNNANATIRRQNMRIREIKTQLTAANARIAELEATIARMHEISDQQACEKSEARELVGNTEHVEAGK